MTQSSRGPELNQASRAVMVDPDLRTGRRLIVTENLTANGVAELVGDWFHPDQQPDDEVLQLQRKQMSTETGLLLGRRTFEEFRAYWPHRVDDGTGSTDHLNSVPKYLVSSTLTTPGWANTGLVPGDALLPEVRRLKSTGTGDLGITGSIQVVHTLLKADLVDELRLFIYPVITGQGRNLIPDGVATRHFHLADRRSFSSGVTYLNYTRR